MSKKAPRVKWRKAIKALKDLGWEEVRRSKGSHAILKHPDHDRPVTVVINKPGAVVSATVMKGFKRQMGPDRFQEFLDKC